MGGRGCIFITHTGGGIWINQRHRLPLRLVSVKLFPRTRNAGDARTPGAITSPLELERRGWWLVRGEPRAPRRRHAHLKP